MYGRGSRPVAHEGQPGRRSTKCCPQHALAASSEISLHIKELVSLLVCRGELHTYCRSFGRPGQGTFCIQDSVDTCAKVVWTLCKGGFGAWNSLSIIAAVTIRASRSVCIRGINWSSRWSRMPRKFDRASGANRSTIIHPHSALQVPSGSHHSPAGSSPLPDRWASAAGNRCRNSHR